ncbi:MAG: DMT family transporter [Parvularculaceae bacterium]
MAYVTLAAAIVAEVIATSALKASDGLTRLGPTTLVVVGYCLSFYFLSLSLRTLPLGVAYAIWSGVGVVLIAGIGWSLFGQRLDTPATIGIALIVTGVMVIRLFSETGTA